jgi:GTP cyclohydrolase IA
MPTGSGTNRSCATTRLRGMTTRVSHPPPLATYPNHDGYDQLVMALAIPVQRLCEQHRMPVAAAAHIGYLPAGLMLDCATLGQLVEFFAARPEAQADLTRQIAEHLDAHLSPHGVGVLVETEQSCGAPDSGSAVAPVAITSALLGQLRTVPGWRREFFALTRHGRSWITPKGRQ